MCLHYRYALPAADLEEAKINAKEAIELYIVSLKEHGEQIPFI